MFSYLSRGYGTWEGIAKLETPDSAISPNRANYLLPPIQEKYHFYDQQFGRNGLYKLPQEKLKLPEVPKNPLHVPKTYSTKRGALLLYSEGCFVPGSRRLKKRPRFKRQKERRLQTMKDLMQLIMDYKKNGCDPLLLEQLWHRMSYSARDVQPGYSPKRYLSHLGQTAFDTDSWKKLVETGSLRSFGTTDDGFLPSLLPDYIDELNHRPQPYKTMSLPPVSPSSSMLGSFTFYKSALSTGAASMVSLPSVNSETVDELSTRSACTFVESLADRLAEVESESGFKQDYDALTAKEKEDLLTQLLMEVTLHSQGDVITVPTQGMAESSTINTDESYLIDDKDSRSVESLQSYHSVKPPPSENSDKTKSIASAKSSKSLKSGKGSRSSLRPKSSGSSKSVKSCESRDMPVCSLPPIVSKESVPDSVGFEEVEKKARASLSSSGSGLSLVVDTFAIGLNGIDIEIEDESFYLEGTDIGLERKSSSEARSLRSERTISGHSLIEALDIQDGESLHWLRDETLSLRSFGPPDGVLQETRRIDDGASGDGFADVDLVKDMVHGDDEVSGDVIGGGDDDAGVVRDGARADVHDTGDENDGDVLSLSIGRNKEEFYTDGRSGDLESTKQAVSSIDLVPVTEQQTPHISLTCLQNEVRLVAEEVLSRPTSGRILAKDAEVATFLLMERMEELLGPALTDNVRTRSAAPNKVRPLGQPRNSEIKEKRRIRSAGASLASRSLVKPEEKQVEEVASEEKEVHVEMDAGSLSKSEGSDRSVDDVIFTVDTIEEADLDVIKETITQSPQEGSATPSPEGELLTVKDSQAEVEQVEETKRDTATMKKRKERVPKEVKVKKRVASKLGSVAKSKKKKTSTALARNEPPKATPFRAGLVPESKPPKGLEQKSGGTRKKGNGKQTSPDLQESPEKAELKTEPDKINGLCDEVPPPGIPHRVDSETGEIEHGESPSKTEKSPSLGGSKSPPDEKVSISRDEVVSARTPTESPREKSPSVHEVTPSPSFDETSTPRDKTPSSRDRTPSPREPKPCPRERDADLREEVSADVVTESVQVVAREPSPEVVLTEKQRRANARAAQRAAAAERRRLEVERKRREREEARRRAQEEEARLEVLRKESEEEMKRREEERRIQQEREERERMRVEAEQNERARQERLMIERQRQAREEWKRKKEQLMAQRKFDEELRKERERVEQQIEEERRREYEEKIAHLEEEERERLLEERRLEEERIKREIQEEKERQEEERRRILEERRKMEEELAAARERQLSRRIFLETLLKDFQNLLLDQRITRAFTFSYFDILPWFKDRWRDLQEDRPLSKRPPTQLDTVPEEPEIDMEHTV